MASLSVPPVTNLSPGGRYIAIGNAQGLITVLEAVSQNLMFVATGHDGPVSALSWSKDGAMLASGGQDQRVQVWDVSRGGVVCTFGHSGSVSSLAWAPNNKQLVSSSGREFKRWNIEEELKQPA